MLTPTSDEMICDGEDHGGGGDACCGYGEVYGGGDDACDICNVCGDEEYG